MELKNKIGIDKISLTGFTIKNLNVVNYDLEKKTKTTRQRVLKDRFERYQLIKYRTEEQSYYKLIFYPSRILWGNNIKNVNIKELLKALEWTRQELETKGIYLEELEKATIKDIEININLKIDFENYINIFRLLIPKGAIYGKNRNDNINIETIETKTTTTGFKIYNKGKQQNTSFKLVRFEYWLENSNYYQIVNKLGYDNTLQTLIKKPFLLVDIFKLKIKDMFRKALKYIKEKIYKPLKKEYTNIKKYNSVVSKKSIKPIYKQLENIKPFGIFDKNILIGIIKASQYERNKNREIKKIMEIYKDFNEMEKLKNIYKLIIINGI